MAISKTLMVALVLSQLVLLHAAQLHQLAGRFDGEKKRGLQSIDCGAACDGRCEKSSRRNMCKRACGTCCARCGCVPPGTAGHQDACPCYFNQTTHSGKPKCP